MDFNKRTGCFRSHFIDPALPGVVGRRSYSMRCAPLGHRLAAASAVRDLLTPQCQVVLVVDRLQPCFIHYASLPCSISQSDALHGTARESLALA